MPLKNLGSPLWQSRFIQALSEGTSFTYRELADIWGIGKPNVSAQVNKWADLCPDMVTIEYSNEKSGANVVHLHADEEAERVLDGLDAPDEEEAMAEIEPFVFDLDAEPQDAEPVAIEGSDTIATDC